MRIEVEGVHKAVRFDEIRVGETFYDVADDLENEGLKEGLMIRVEPGDGSDSCLNVVTLNDGLMYEYNDTDKVIPVDAKVVIE